MTPFPRRLGAAVAASALVALATYLGTVLLYFAISGSTAAALAQVLGFFLPFALALVVLLGVVLLLERGRRLWLTLVLAFVAAVLSVGIGTVLGYAVQDTTVSGALIAYAASTAVGYGLLFEVLAVVATAVLARRVTSRMLRPRAGRRVALVRPPSPSLADGQLTHQKRVPVDAELAVRQWRDYVAALEGAGWSVEQVSAAPELPDSVFVEDAVVVLDGTAVLGYPGAESRRGEVADVRAAVTARGFAVRAIEWPGTLDGGDVLAIGSTLYVGRSSRTNAEGIRQLRALAAPLGRTVVTVPVAKVLHLKTAHTALPDGTVLGYAKTPSEIGRSAAPFERFLAVPEPAGAHVVVLAHDAVLIAASAPLTAKLIADLGYRVVVVDISEFEKLEGSVTCLSVLLP